MDACDHSKQGLDSEIAPETQHYPDSEVTHGCDPSKSALGEEVSHENFYMDANDQSKQGPEPEIDTENQNGPESEVTDGGDTSINVPGVNIGTDGIVPGEGGPEDKIDGSTVLPSNPPLNGKALLYKQYLESNKNKKKRKKKIEKETKGKRQKTTKEKSRKTSSYCKEQDWKISI